MISLRGYIILPQGVVCNICNVLLCLLFASAAAATTLTGSAATGLAATGLAATAPATTGLAATAPATTGPAAASQGEPGFEQLGRQQQWLHLLHYHSVGIRGGLQSQVDTPDFFLATKGKRDPVAELAATYRALMAERTRNNDSVFCRYPARVAWLRQHLPAIAELRGNCGDLEQWLAKIDAAQLTLVFPAAYLNSPSSMYGHTLIRVNRRQGGNPLLDYVVNFAANSPPGDNEIVFAWKGLTGGYPGVVSILPYYEKINDYSFLESRDIWEYKLALTQAEVDQFLRHIWELRGSEFDYFFFTENCSYQLLALLDAASERFNLAGQFRLRAIPADTVRAVVEAGIVAETSYRPSILTQMQNKYTSLAPAQQALAAALAEPAAATLNVFDRVELLEEESAARVLEVAYDYGRFRAIKAKHSSDAASAHSIDLLTRRSRLTSKKLFGDIERPMYRDDEGHHTRRLSITAGNDGVRDYESIALRMAFHDALDPPQGYLPFASLAMINTELRRLHGSSFRSAELQLQKLALIDISSIAPGNIMLNPTSWRVSAGARRLYEVAALAPFIDVGFGRARQWGAWLAYGFVDAGLDVGKPLHDGYQFALGPALGLLRQSSTWSAQFEASFRANDQGREHDTGLAEITLARHFGIRQQLRWRMQYFDSGDAGEVTNQLSWRHFF
ncbi:MAG: DUF4105 domain-containing protein [Pseudomonadales bacterium]